MIPSGFGYSVANRIRDGTGNFDSLVGLRRFVWGHLRYGPIDSTTNLFGHRRLKTSMVIDFFLPSAEVNSADANQLSLTSAAKAEGCSKF